MFGRRKGGPTKREASEAPPHPGPGAASNSTPPPEDIQALFAALRKTQAAYMDRVNRDMPEGVNLVPWAMIPWSVWQGPHADLLFTCNLYPADPWNTMLLPDGAAAAENLRLPIPLHDIPPELETVANGVLRELDDKVTQAHARTSAAIAGGDLEALGQYQKTADAAAVLVRGLAQNLGARAYGDDALVLHKLMFGDALGWV